MNAPVLRHIQRDPSVTPESADLVSSGAPATAQTIDAFWDDVTERVSYLMSLLGAGRNNEALTLCAAYLEGVAHALISMNAQDGEAFADELEEHTSDPFLALVHPLQLVRMAAQIHGLSPSAVHGLAAVFPGPEYTLLRQPQALEVVRNTLAPTDAAIVERAIWRCTIAYVIYDFIRTQSFKRREGVRTVGLGISFRRGESVQALSVPELVSLLYGMIAEARARSHAAERLPDLG